MKVNLSQVLTSVVIVQALVYKVPCHYAGLAVFFPCAPPSGSPCTAPHFERLICSLGSNTHHNRWHVYLLESELQHRSFIFYIRIYFLYFTSLVIMLRTGIYTRMIIMIRVTSVRLSANISFNSHLGWNARCDVERCSFGSGWDVNLRRTVGRRVSHLPADPIILAFV